MLYMNSVTVLHIGDSPKFTWCAALPESNFFAIALYDCFAVSEYDCFAVSECDCFVVSESDSFAISRALL